MGALRWATGFVRAGILEDSAELRNFSELREKQKTKELHKPAVDSRPNCRFIVLLRRTNYGMMDGIIDDERNHLKGTGNYGQNH